MSVGSNVAPVIIKRKKVVSGDAHHGGAWKVAYADFVTAMMAFFMLMWLLNATTEKQRKGIADYFSPTVPINRVSGGSDGMFGGSSIFAENTLPRVGTGATSLRPTAQRSSSGGIPHQFEDGDEDERAKQDKAFKEVEAMLLGRGGETMLDDNQLRHIVTRLTDEGLVIELFDLPERALLTVQNEPTDLLRGLAKSIATAAQIVTNNLSVESHVRSLPVVVADNTVWDEAAYRGQVMRDILEQSGIAPERFNRVTSHADREPVSANPLHVRNNRFEMIFLRRVGTSREF
ncbi:MAG: chemotaxis protein MotB [Rhodobacteraceae bacterium]|nr:chemotaxis protein MotB [Paracoccaceae bacterium]